jgi:hypothetical protein
MQDYKKLMIKENGYFYKHRSDKLERRYRYPYEFKTVEYYIKRIEKIGEKTTEIY